MRDKQKNINERPARLPEVSSLVRALTLIKKSLSPYFGKGGTALPELSLAQMNGAHQKAESFQIALAGDAKNAIEALPVLLGALAIQDRAVLAERTLLTLLDADPSRCRQFSRLAIELLQAKRSFGELAEIMRGQDDNLLEVKLAAPTDNFLSEPLLLKILKTDVLTDVAFEELFINLRKYFLCKASPELLRQPIVIEFLGALAQQCFLNEFVYVMSEEELIAETSLRERVQHGFEQPGELEIVMLLLAAYEPLALVEIPDLGTVRRTNSPLSEVILTTVDPWCRERTISKSVGRVGKFSEDTTLSVANQYEENPYPRWNTMELPRPNSARVILSQHFDEAELTVLSHNPRVLIAGCGTGQHSISAALRYGKEAQVTAIDLSAASLSQAIRKSEEYGIENIEYRQIDLTDLSELGKRFDIIECVGVLHHMKDPLKGWRILVDNLSPGGLMKVGVYSTVARLPILFARKALGLGEIDVATPELMRSYRQRVIASKDQSWSRCVLNIDDFYSLSGCRDLLFHVQEQTFSIDMIKQALDSFGLTFRGFDLNAESLKEYKKAHPEDGTMRNLDNWTQFEVEHPGTFARMYNFWCLKELEVSKACAGCSDQAIAKPNARATISGWMHKAAQEV